MSRPMRLVDEVAQDISQAMRDPNLTAEEAAAIAAVLVMRRCPLAEVRTALRGLRARAITAAYNNWDVSLLVTALGVEVDFRRRTKIAVLQPAAGRVTNVIQFTFKACPYLDSNGRSAKVLNESELRAMVRRFNQDALYRAVSGKPVGNTNDPDLTESPEWGRTLQAAWVRNTLQRRGER